MEVSAAVADRSRAPRGIRALSFICLFKCAIVWINSAAEQLRETPLYDLHVRLIAKRLPCIMFFKPDCTLGEP